MLTTDAERLCATCGASKPLTSQHFRWRSERQDFQTVCKACRSPKPLPRPAVSAPLPVVAREPQAPPSVSPVLSLALLRATARQCQLDGDARTSCQAVALVLSPVYRLRQEAMEAAVWRCLLGEVTDPADRNALQWIISRREGRVIFTTGGEVRTLDSIWHRLVVAHLAPITDAERQEHTQAQFRAIHQYWQERAARTR